MNLSTYRVCLSKLTPGTVLRVSRGPIDHVGMVSDRKIDGEPLIIGFSKDTGGFEEVCFADFARGKPVTVDGYLGQAPPALVIRRAREISLFPYRLASFNCEHFVRYCHGVRVVSPQLHQWAFAAVAAALVAAAARA